ncbi:MAG: type II secretion system protein N [Alcanivorax sp.]|nr:type II secretion system protein N [Alcanivorax sp.]
MPRLLTLTGVFVASLVIFLVWLMPAQPFVRKLDGVMLGEAPLQLHQIRGRIWQGEARWRWQGYRGELRWATRWRGLSPGLTLDVAGGGLELDGWAGVSPSAVTLRELALRVPLAEISRGMAEGQADGVVTGNIEHLRWHRRSGDVFASGALRYGGGQITWPPDGSARVPPLEGRLYTEDNVARLEIVDPQGTRLVDGEAGNGEAALRVYRAWPRLLGVSQGGSDSDVVFQVSQQL